MWLLVLEAASVVGIGVGIEAVIPVRGLRPFRRLSRDPLLQHVQREEVGVASCCCSLVDQSRIARDSGDSRCRPVS